MAIVTGTIGDDTLNGDVTDDELLGLAGNDLLNGRGGRDRLEGGSGNDTYVVDSSDDLVIEIFGGGFDTIFSEVNLWLADAQFVEVLSARSWASISNLQLFGNASANWLYGNAGNNFLDGGGGSDVLTGFGGNDIYLVNDFSDQVLEDANGGFDVVYTEANYALTENSHVELLSARDWHSTTSLQLYGNSFDNSIDGNDGDNFIDGRAGADVMFGFEGDDIYVVDNVGDVVSDTRGSDLIYTTVSYSLNNPGTSSVESLIARDIFSTYALNLTGNLERNTLVGNDGANVLDGIGDGGGDILVGHGGDDIYYGGRNRDIIVEEVDDGIDTLFAVNPSGILAANVENVGVRDRDTTVSTSVTGNDLNNIMWGSAGRNGMDGREGADTMIGYEGDDFYQLDNSGDVVIEAVGGGQDTIRFTSIFTYELAADVEVELIQGFTVGNLTIIGNQFAQEIVAGSGDDFLDGRGGSDVLTAFNGTDTFAFTTGLGVDNVDSITMFQTGVDRIALDDAIFTGLTPGALASGAFVTGSSAQDADDRIVYDSATGALSFDADGNGSGAAVQFALLQTGLALSATDFMVI